MDRFGGHRDALDSVLVRDPLKMKGKDMGLFGRGNDQALDGVRVSCFSPVQLEPQQGKNA